jgi:hypothetical protein
MQAETRTLTQLFQPDVRYIIPLYQRPYVWTEQRQWSPLWEDIATVAEHVFTEGASRRGCTEMPGAWVRRNVFTTKPKAKARHSVPTPDEAACSLGWSLSSRSSWSDQCEASLPLC